MRLERTLPETIRRAITRRVVSVVLALSVGSAAACAPQPAPPPATRTVSAPTAPAVSSAAPPLPTAAPTVTPPPATRPDLVICLALEPETLDRYALPEADGGLSRAHVLAALEAAPADLLEAGEVQVAEVAVAAGDWVVDALGRVVTLTAGVTVTGLEGVQITAADAGALRLPQMTVRFTLRPELRWSDGAPLTAADFVLGFTRAASPISYNPQREQVARTAHYQALDARTLEWRGLPGAVGAAYRPDLWPPAVGAPDVERAPFGSGPLSSGPFQVAEWQPGERLVLERNPHYWRAGEGRPRLQRLIYRFVPDERLGAELAAGGCAVAPRRAAWRTLTEVPAEVRPFLLSTESQTQVSVIFGLAPAAGPGFLADRRARRAVAACLDRAALTPAAPAARRAALYPAGLEALAFDPAYGRAALAELGWKEDGEGWVDQAGRPLRLTLVAGAEAETAGVLAEQLRTNCGIETELRVLTPGEALADWPAGPLFGRQFDLAVIAWNSGAPGACALFLSEQIAAAANPAGANLARYQNPAYDQACRRALTALTPEAAAQADAAAQAVLAQDVPLWPAFFRLNLAAARPELAGFAPGAAGAASDLGNLDTLTVWP